MLLAELEQAKLSLSQSVNELSQNLKEQGATFRAQVYVAYRPLYSMIVFYKLRETLVSVKQ